MSTEQIQQIPLEEIRSSDGNRKYGGFDPVKLQELADSIRSAGVLQPVLVRPNDKEYGPSPLYELVAGERRWRAAKLAGLEVLPCVVRQLDDVQVMKIQLIENLQREDIHPLDEADGYARLIDRAGYDVEHLAQDVDRSPSYVYQRLKLRDLVPEAKKMLVEGKMTAGHAILIARLQPKTQTEALRQLTSWNGEVISVRNLNEWIHRSVLMELSRACWRLDDEDLVPKAGSCQACPKRTGFQPALFADICNDGKQIKDYCTDRACFGNKEKALIAQRRKELGDTDYLEAIDGWTPSPPKGALKSWEWSECKKNAPGAKRVLIVGGETPGRLTYGKPRKNSNESQASAQELAAQKRQDHKAAVEDAFRKEIYKRTVEAAQKKLKQGLNKELLRLAIKVFYRDAYDSGQSLAELEDWDGETKANKAIDTMDEPTLRLTLLKLAIASQVDYRPWGQDDALLEAAEIFGVDPKAARKEASNQVKARMQKAEAGK